MTKVTRDLRLSLHEKIMKDLPSRNYMAEIFAMAQEIVIKHSPKQVQELYADESTRGYLSSSYLDVRQGNQSVPLYRLGGDKGNVYGLKVTKLAVHMDDIAHENRLPEGSLYRELVLKLHESGLVAAYFAQEELRKSVSERLMANLAAATTLKRLYEILEPELHHYIPKDEAKANLPACVAPVVDDLRKLGADLPAVPKAE